MSIIAVSTTCGSGESDNSVVPIKKRPARAASFGASFRSPEKRRLLPRPSDELLTLERLSPKRRSGTSSHAD